MSSFALLLVAVLSQTAPPPPPPPLPEAGTEIPGPPDPTPARVRLKSSIQGVYLVQTRSQRKVCFEDCSGELKVDHALEYELQNAKGEWVGDRIFLEPGITEATIEYGGRNLGLLVPGAILLGFAAIGVLAAVVLEFIAVFFFSWQSTSNFAPVALAGLAALGGAVVFGVPGGIMLGVGGKERMTVTTVPPRRER